MPWCIHNRIAITVNLVTFYTYTTGNLVRLTLKSQDTLILHAQIQQTRVVRHHLNLPRRKPLKKMEINTMLEKQHEQ